MNNWLREPSVNKVLAYEPVQWAEVPHGQSVGVLTFPCSGDSASESDKSHLEEVVCVHPHVLKYFFTIDEKCKWTVLSVQKKVEITERLNRSETATKLAQQFGVVKSIILQLKKNKNKLLHFVSSRGGGSVI